MLEASFLQSKLALKAEQLLKTSSFTKGVGVTHVLPPQSLHLFSKHKWGFEQSGEISINSYSCYLVHSLIICNLPQTPERAAITSLFQGILKITNNLEV